MHAVELAPDLRDELPSRLIDDHHAVVSTNEHAMPRRVDRHVVPPAFTAEGVVGRHTVLARRLLLLVRRRLVLDPDNSAVHRVHVHLFDP